MRALLFTLSFLAFFPRAGNAQQAALWIPAEDSDKSEVLNLLETGKDLAPSCFIFDQILHDS